MHEETSPVPRLERYFDGVLRAHARVEEVGPFTLFVGEPDGWTFCARPRLGGDGGHDPTAVATVLSRLRELGLPEVIEWVHEVSPDLLAAVRDEGSLEVEEIPLMVLAGEPSGPVHAERLTVRVVDPASPEGVGALAAARSVSRLAFAAPGTATGPAGEAERDAGLEPVPPYTVAALRDGKAHWVVAELEGHGVIACGRHQPWGGTTEIVGVATLPAYRRRGLGAAVTVALVEHARATGADTVFLTASSEEVARIYGRLGFQRVGTGFAAERHQIAIWSTH